MHGPREVLNELKWSEGKSLDRAVIHYVHRGGPRGEAVVHGHDIRALHASFMEIADAMIPYHRIFLIELDGRELWRRGPRGQQEKH